MQRSIPNRWQSRRSKGSGGDPRPADLAEDRRQLRVALAAYNLIRIPNLLAQASA
jgi:hypothetical protein